MTATHKSQNKVQALSSLLQCRHSFVYPSGAPLWDSRAVSGAGVVHYHIYSTGLTPLPRLSAPPHSSHLFFNNVANVTSAEDLLEMRFANIVKPQRSVTFICSPA